MDNSWIGGRRAVPWHWLALGVVLVAAWATGLSSNSRPGAAATLAVAIPVGIAGASVRGWFAAGEELPARGRYGWLLLGIGAVSLSVGATSAAGPGLVAGDMGTALGACLGVIGLLWLIGGRVRDRWIDAVVEALLVAAPISYLAVAFLVDRRAESVTLPEAMAVVVAVALDVVLVVCALHLRSAQPARSPAADLLVAGSTALLLVHGARAWTSLSNDSNLDLSSAAMVVGAMAAGMWAVATLCPEARLEPDRIETLPTPLTRVRLAIIVLCVAVGPMTLAVRVTTERTDGIGGLAAGAVVVAGVAVAYLVRLVEQRARVEYLALHDDLCQLPNRVLLDDRISTALGQASRNGSSVALLFLDLDRFKTINDSLGHAAGNELLRAVGERLSGSVRAGDTVARLGGDEFAVLIPEVRSASTAGTVAEKVISSFAEPFEIHGRQLFVSPSIGISLHPQDAADATELLRNADAAMYRSKANGRNTFEVYTPELNETAHRRLTMETFLHRAVERDELVLHYQPKVELRSGRIVGMEALLRWQHPELGLLLPGDFIPLAEETGLIVPVGEWALEQACAQTKRWSDAGHDTVSVAVNLSGRQFQHLRVGDMVARVLRSTGLDPRALELELTESLALQDPDGIVATLEELKDIGVQCSIDDFGTGYSGLQYLSRFPIDKLKIDRFFVKEISNPADEGRIVAAVIALAHGLQLDVVAEGVETEEQLAFLHRSGCDEMQGFLFSRPVPADEFEALLASPPAFSRGASGDLVPAEPRLRLVGGAQPPLR